MLLSLKYIILLWQDVRGPPQIALWYLLNYGDGVGEF